MYNVDDFINGDVKSKNIRLGWKIEVNEFHRLVLRYTMINFDWKSVVNIDDEKMNKFISSESFAVFKERIYKARNKINRMYFEADSIWLLKYLVEQSNLLIDIDKIINSAIRKKSEKIKEYLNKEKKLTELNEKTEKSFI